MVHRVPAAMVGTVYLILLLQPAAAAAVAMRLRSMVGLAAPAAAAETAVPARRALPDKELRAAIQQHPPAAAAAAALRLPEPQRQVMRAVPAAAGQRLRFQGHPLLTQAVVVVVDE